MMRAGGAMAMAVATLLVCCNADPHQDQDMRAGGHVSGERYDVNDLRPKEELEDFMRFLMQYKNELDREKNLGLLERNLNAYEHNPLRGPAIGKGLGKNINAIGGSSALGSDTEDRVQYARYLDSLGGGNFVRTLDTIGGGNFVRNLDPIGGANFVKRTLDTIGGANFVKRTLDSIGGANFVKRNLDQIGGPNLVKRYLDSIGGGNFVRRQVDSLGGGNFV